MEHYNIDKVIAPDNLGSSEAMTSNAQENIELTKQNIHASDKVVINSQKLTKKINTTQKKRTSHKQTNNRID